MSDYSDAAITYAYEIERTVEIQKATGTVDTSLVGYRIGYPTLLMDIDKPVSYCK